MRLCAGVAYKKLREGVTRQHNWITNRVDEITNYTARKIKDSSEKISVTKYIKQAVTELKLREPLLHTYAIPTHKDIYDHLIKGTKFGKFRSKSFPTAEEFLDKVGALEWFNGNYGVHRDNLCLPTMNLTVIGIQDIGEHNVYDIQVENTHSFLANGIVSHNCLIAHGTSSFLKETFLERSDNFKVHICNECGSIAICNPKKNIYKCNMCRKTTKISEVRIPYAAKLFMQELEAMSIKPKFIVK